MCLKGPQVVAIRHNSTAAGGALTNCTIQDLFYILLYCFSIKLILVLMKKEISL